MSEGPKATGRALARPRGEAGGPGFALDVPTSAPGDVDAWAAAPAVRGTGVDPAGAERFELRGTLGTGGAGVVYRAFDRVLNREVALKALRVPSGRDLFRFKREFRALSDLIHPNLVALHELFAVGGEWYFTMERVEGVSFIDFARPTPPADLDSPVETTETVTVNSGTRTRQQIIAAALDADAVRAALPQLGDALVALHAAGKLHRDLKPSNVLVTRLGRLVVLDFGLVGNRDENSGEHLAVGTPAYMSPEQAADQELTPASDWYAVGAMLYEAMTGRRPFEGGAEQVMRRKQHEVPPTPTSLGCVVPADLESLTMALLRPDPRSRPDGLEVLRQLGHVPTPATRDIARAHVPSPLLGRIRELAALRSAFTDSRRRGGTVFVSGPSGIGKSALVRRFLESVSDAAIVLEGRCYERESVPYKLLDAVIDSLGGVLMSMPVADVESILPRELPSLVRLFPGLRRVTLIADLTAHASAPPDPQELRQRAFAALTYMFGRLARWKPLVISIDDIQWGDLDSASFLADSVHHAQPGLMYLFAHRPEDDVGVVQALREPAKSGARTADIRDLQLTGLSADDARDVVRAVGGDGADFAAITARAGGSPLLLTELARAQSHGATVSLETLIATRAARLSAGAQALLVAIAVAGTVVPIEVVADAAGVVGGHAEAAELSGDRLARLRRIDGALYVETAHDFVRESVTSALDPAGLRGWNAALAQAFERHDAGLNPEAVVSRWLAAGQPAAAAAAAVSAAVAAEQALAFRRAAELFALAVELGDDPPHVQRDLLRRQAYAFTCVGMLDEAAATYRRAADLIQDDQAAELERLALEQLLRGGRIDEGLQLAEKLLATVGIRLPVTSGPAVIAKVIAQRVSRRVRGYDFTERPVFQIPAADLRRIDILYSVVSGVSFLDPALGRLVQNEFLKHALDSGEGFRVSLALGQELAYLAIAGEKSWPEVEAVGAKQRALAQRVGHPHVVGSSDVTLGIAAYMCGRLQEAKQHLEQGLRTLRDYGSGVRWEVDVAEQYLLTTRLSLGELREVARHVPLALRDAIERGDYFAQLCLRSWRTNLIWLVLHKPDEARHHANPEREHGRAASPVQAFFETVANAQIDLYLGQGEAAVARIEAAAPAFRRAGLGRVHGMFVEFESLRGRAALAVASRAQGKARTAGLRTARDIGDELAKSGGWARGVGALLRGQVALLERDHERAESELARAENLLSDARQVIWLEAAHWVRGRNRGGAVGKAQTEAALDALRDAGASHPDEFLRLYLGPSIEDFDR